MASALMNRVRAMPGFTIVLFYLVFDLITVAAFYGLDPQTKLRLSSSLATPWGVMTSVFINDSFMQMIDNLSAMAINLFALVLLIYLARSSNRRHKPKRELLIYCLCPLFSVMLANIAAIPYPDSVLKGASGVTYAMMGVILEVSIWDISHEASERQLRLRRNFLKDLSTMDPKGKLHLMIDTTFFVVFMTYIIFSPVGFLNMPHNVQTVVYVMSIVIGFMESWILL